MGNSAENYLEETLQRIRQLIEVDSMSWGGFLLAVSAAQVEGVVTGQGDEAEKVMQFLARVGELCTEIGPLLTEGEIDGLRQIQEAWRHVLHQILTGVRSQLSQDIQDCRFS